MAYEARQCATCIHFAHTGPADKGTCAIGIRNGVTYGRYICTNWRPNTGGGSNTIDEQRPAERLEIDPRYKEPSSHAGNGVQADVVRIKRDIKKLRQKGVNYAA